MIGLNKSPNITKFAMANNVKRSSLVDLLRHAFGNHVDLLKQSSAEYQPDNTLRLYSGRTDIFFRIQELSLPYDVRIEDDTSVIGFVEAIHPTDDKVYLLISGR